MVSRSDAATGEVSLLVGGEGAPGIRAPEGTLGIAAAGWAGEGAETADSKPEAPDRDAVDSDAF